MTINLRQLEVLHAIITTGSVTGAARHLHVTQPAVSAVLKHLEQRLQFKLFERVGGRLRATPEAQALMPDVAEIFGRVSALGRVTQNMRDGLAGRVIIASSPTLVDSLLPRAIARFRSNRPGVAVTLRSLPTALAVERVARRDVDVGVVYGPVDDPGVDVEELVDSQITCVLPPRHRLAKRRSIDASDLAGEPVISLNATTRLGSAIVTQCLAAGLPVPEPGIEPSSSLTACLLVREGAGIALVDRTAAIAGTFRDLVFREFRPRISVKVQLIFPRERPRSRAVVDVTAALRQVIAADMDG